MGYLSKNAARFGLALALTMGASSIAMAQAVLHRGNGDEIETLDPHKSTDVSGSWIQFDLFEGLMAPNAKGEPIPGVAESYTVSDDGKTYTFKLRQNANWSDGTPVTADDFVFSWLRLLDPKTASDYGYFLWPVENAEAYNKGELTDASKVGLKAVDAKTFQVTLRNPTPYLVQALVHHSTYAISKANYEKFGEDYIKPGNLVSNGAFTLAEHVPQSHLKVVKNPKYWDAANVKLDAVVFYPIPDQDAELKRYRAGELHVTYDVPQQQIPWLEQNMKAEFRSNPYFGTYYYAYNLQNEPWKSNAKLRKALSLAVDREVLTGKITQGGEIPAYGFVPPGTSNYTAQTVDYAKSTQAQRDEEAKKLIAEAGYGKDKPLDVEFMYNTSENHKKTAVAVANMWKQKLGVNVNLVNQEWKVFLETRDKKQFKDLARQGWIGDYNDANNFLELLRTDIGEANPSAYSNPKYDELMKQASASSDLKKRAELMQQAEKLMLDDHPIIPLYFYATQHMVSPKIASGWEDNVSDYHPSRFIVLK